MVTTSEVQPGAWLLCLVHSLTERGEMVDKGLPLRILSMDGAGVSSVAGTVLNLFLFIEHRAVLLYCAKYFICKMYT